MQQKYDIVIVGAGPAGLSFACSLADSNLDILMVEKSSLADIKKPKPDGREIALTHLSKKILSKLGVWQRFTDIAPLKAAKVMNGNSEYTMDFDNKNPQLDALGYLVSNNIIRQMLYEEFTENVSNVKLLTNTEVTDVNIDMAKAVVSLSDGQTVQTSLVVAADSRFSATRRNVGISASMQDFSRTAVVCNMEHTAPNNATAIECFLYGRTMAVLPMNNNVSSIVITVTADKADALLNMSEDDFNLDVARRLRQSLGDMKLVGKRHSYPLVAVYADNFVKPRAALIGDAAVGMHPVTAHGFNLGLRGQASLARALIKAHEESKDIGDMEVLRKYQTEHMMVAKPLYHGTNSIVKLFTNETYPAKILRDATLRLANNFFPIKDIITRALTETKSSKLPFLNF